MIEPENPEIAKVNINFLERDNYNRKLDIKTKLIKMWTDLGEEDAQKLAIEYLNIPIESREENIKDWLVKMGVITK